MHGHRLETLSRTPLLFGCEARVWFRGLGRGGRRGGDLHGILAEGIDRMVVPSKLRAPGFQAHFDRRGCGRGEGRMSSLYHMAGADFPLEITGSR
jgi:hypothetical protein